METTPPPGALVGALMVAVVPLPPTVIGFYFLVAFGQGSPLGAWLAASGIRLVFTLQGLLLVSVLVNLPFMVQPVHNAMASIGERPMEVAATLRASRLDTFFSVVLPLSRRGIITGTIMSFAHTVGEFGVVLMLGGNIPGVTRVASIALYDETQTLNYAVAHSYALLLLAISFAMLMLIGLLRRGARLQARPKLR